MRLNPTPTPNPRVKIVKQATKFSLMYFIPIGTPPLLLTIVAPLLDINEVHLLLYSIEFINVCSKLYLTMVFITKVSTCVSVLTMVFITKVSTCVSVLIPLNGLLTWQDGVVAHCRNLVGNI